MASRAEAGGLLAAAGSYGSEGAGAGGGAWSGLTRREQCPGVVEMHGMTRGTK
jgi:hypothetical protein